MELDKIISFRALNTQFFPDQKSRNFRDINFFGKKTHYFQIKNILQEIFVEGSFGALLFSINIFCYEINIM